jgi:hypothetical protein
MAARWIFIVTALGGLSARADLKITSKYTANGRSEESTVWFKGGRQRFDLGKDGAIVQQCDRKRMVELNHKTRTYTVVPFAAPESARQGGRVITRVTVTDTGEQRPMFGFVARRLKTTLTREPSPDACDRTRQRIETDGWYIDLKEPRCDVTPEAEGGCRDDIRVERTGPPNDGFPLMYTTTVFGEDGKPVSTLSMQVTALEGASLPAAMFDVPDGYTAAKTEAAEAQKTPGQRRIGAVAIRNGSSRQVETEALDRQLLAQLRESKMDVVRLPSTGTEAAARSQHCDYLLYTDVTDVSQPQAGKLRGLMRHAPLVGAKESFQAEVKYRLAPLDGTAPLFESSAAGKTGGLAFNWHSAMSLAQTAGQMALSGKLMFGPAMLMNPAMMRSLLGPGFGGAGPVASDPVMGGLARMLGSQAGAAPDPKGAEEAVAAALHQEVQAILTRLNPQSPEDSR